MKPNIIRDKSYAFALNIIGTYQKLAQKKEFVLSRQLLKSGTSIGANIEEAIGGQSKNDFISKLTISYKEARETLYWLHLLTDSNFLTSKQSEGLIRDCEEILRIITAIQKTSKNIPATKC